MRTAYLTDLSDAEWSYLEPHFPAPEATGRPQLHHTREVLDLPKLLRQIRTWSRISGTLGDSPDEYPVSTGQGAVASVNKAPNDKGMLRLGLYVNGDEVSLTADDGSTAPLTVYSASAEH
jgi:transposase